MTEIPGRKIAIALYKAYCEEQTRDMLERWKFAKLLNLKSVTSGLLYGQILETKINIQHISEWPPKGEDVDLIKIFCGESTHLVGTTVSIHGTDEDRQAAVLADLKADKNYLLDWIARINAAEVLLSKLIKRKDDA